MRKPHLDVERLKKKREEKGWSKNYAAEEMNLAQSVYFRYESGESSPSYSAIRNMALTLGTSVEYLTGKSDDDTPKEILVSAKDPRLGLIVEMFPSCSEEEKQRIFMYAKRICSRE
jgi:transcriptional regulator with XRE-family HTH domain